MAWRRSRIVKGASTVCQDSECPRKSPTIPRVFARDMHDGTCNMSYIQLRFRIFTLIHSLALGQLMWSRTPTTSIYLFCMLGLPDATFIAIYIWSNIAATKTWDCVFTLDDDRGMHMATFAMFRKCDVSHVSMSINYCNNYQHHYSARRADIYIYIYTRRKLEISIPLVY